MDGLDLQMEGHIERIVVQIKSGHVGVKDIRELRDVISKQKAAIGILLTLEEPTSEMSREAKTTDHLYGNMNTQRSR